jgi:hypothetical protein
MYLPSCILALHAAICGNVIIKVVMRKKKIVVRIIANSEIVRFTRVMGAIKPSCKLIFNQI